MNPADPDFLERYIIKCAELGLYLGKSFQHTLYPSIQKNIVFLTEWIQLSKEMMIFFDGVKATHCTPDELCEKRLQEIETTILYRTAFTKYKDLIRRTLSICKSHTNGTRLLSNLYIGWRALLKHIIAKAERQVERLIHWRDEGLLQLPASHLSYTIR